MAAYAIRVFVPFSLQFFFISHYLFSNNISVAWCNIYVVRSNSNNATHTNYFKTYALTPITSTLFLSFH